MELLIIAIAVLGIIAIFTPSKKKPEPPKPKPTERDKVVCEMVLDQYGRNIASMTEAGRASLIDAIKKSGEH